MKISRRNILGMMAATGPAALSNKLSALAVNSPANPKGRVATSQERDLATGPFQPTWESLKAQYKTPEWFRDAKFGIWNHWSAQCVPEEGDWYARKMYIQGDPHYDYHVKTLRPSLKVRLQGHRLHLEGRELAARRRSWISTPGRRREVLRVPRQPPRQLRQLQLKYHDWNSTRLGPMKDIVGTWAAIGNATASASASPTTPRTPGTGSRPPTATTPEGPLAGVRYDAAP